MNPVFSMDSASVRHVAMHLRQCDDAFVPPLSSRVDVEAYAGKLTAHARCLEAWVGAELAGLIAVYCNDPAKRMAFISSVSVLPAYRGCGLASVLLERCLQYVRALGFRRVELEVGQCNIAARALYLRHGFVNAESANGVQHMRLPIQ